MGKGPTNKQDVQIITSVAGAAADDGGKQVSPCAQPRSVVICVDPGATIAVGDSVTIVAGRPPSVRIGTHRVGDVEQTDASDLEGCIKLGYRFSGTTTDVDARLNAAVALIRGLKE